MFLDFFYTLRAHKIPVTVGEFLDFLKVVEKSTQVGGSLKSTALYQLARLTLIKDIKYFDAYDMAFAQTFHAILKEDPSFRQKLQEWLENSLKKKEQTEGMLKPLEIPPEDLIKELEKRRREQKERHDGGNRWIGTGGTSPFGHGGMNPSGIRIGGSSQRKSALAVGMQENYQEYRTDLAFNIRQMKVCLKKLRLLKREGRKELSIPKTIVKTCNNAGDLEVVLESTRKNSLKLILLMDVGGSMTPHSKRVGQLFSACHQINHFKEFRSYYFHNIIYDSVFKDARMHESLPVQSLFKRYGPETRVIVVGDAAMAPYELFSMTQDTLNYYQYYGIDQASFHKGGKVTGYDRLLQLKKRFPFMIWINPDSPNTWFGQTTKKIGEKVPMFFLSVDGLQKGVESLLRPSLK